LYETNKVPNTNLTCWCLCIALFVLFMGKGIHYLMPEEVALNSNEVPYPLCEPGQIGGPLLHEWLQLPLNLQPKFHLQLHAQQL
jgi:hypothetical protein